METGAFGWGFKDQIQPVMDNYDRQIDDVRLNGVGGQLARMQAMDSNAPGRGATDMPGVNRVTSLARGNQMELGSNIATVPSLDDAAQSSPFNLNDRDLAAIRNRSDIQQGIQLGASILAGPIVERVLPEEGIIGPIAKLVGKAIDAYDGIHALAEPSEEEKLEQAYQQALFHQLNGMTMQRSLSAGTPPAARGFFPVNGSMLFDSGIIYAGMIGVVGLAVFIGAALAYMRAVNAISVFLKLEYPAAWHRVFQGDTRAGFSFEPGKDVESLTISWIVGGIYRLGLSDPRYSSLVWIARRWLILCAVLFVAGVWALGWITRRGGVSLFH